MRSLLKSKFYTSSVILGFGTALVICTLVTTLVVSEYAADDFHKAPIYRVLMTSPVGFSRDIITFHELPERLEEFPEVDKVTHCYYPGFASLSINSNNERISYKEKSVLYCDTVFFKLFGFKLLAGNPDKCLSRPYSIVLTVDKVMAYFGSIDVLGDIIEFKGNSYTITGVVDHPNSISHLNFDFLLSYKTLPPPNDPMSNGGFTYFSFKSEKTDVNQFVHKLNTNRSKLLSFKPAQWPSDPFQIESVRDAYFNVNYPEYLSNVVKSRDKKTLALFTIVSASIFFVAAINFLIFFFTKTLFNSKEISIKKIFGVHSAWIQIQFFLEAFAILIVSFSVAIILALLILPQFNIWTDSTLDPSFFLNPFSILLQFGIIILFSIVLGILTLKIFNSLQSGNLLSSQLNVSRSRTRILSIIFLCQLIFSATLLISNHIIAEQIKFLYSHPIGYDRKNIIEIDLGPLPSEYNAQSLKNELVKNSIVESTSICFGGPLTGRWERDITYNNKSENLGYYQVDEDFISTLKMSMVYGSNFRKDYNSDSSYLVINETAAKFFDIGFNIDTLRSDLPIGGNIVGIVKDFHYSSFKSRISPIVLELTRYKTLGDMKGKMLVRINVINDFAIKSIHDIWNRLTNSAPFEYSLIENDYSIQYRDDVNESKLLELASFAVLIITCFGMIGLSYFFTFVKLKEIAIRKVLGASELRLFFSWSIKILIGIAVSLLIAFPLAKLLTESWMKDFVYKSPITISAVLLPLITILVSLTLSSIYNVRKALRGNPAEILKY